MSTMLKEHADHGTGGLRELTTSVSHAIHGVNSQGWQPPFPVDKAAHSPYTRHIPNPRFIPAVSDRCGRGPTDAWTDRHTFSAGCVPPARRDLPT
jgi:hypothetical protein